VDKPTSLAIQVVLILIIVALQPALGPYGILFVGVGLGIMASELRLALFTSFMTTFSIWVSYAIYIDYPQKFYLARVIASVFGLPHPLFSYLVSGLIGAVPCALIALTTYYFKQAVISEAK
jgi:hypothetical protein